MGDVTEWLLRARGGDDRALDRVFELLYPELRRLARARLRSSGRTLTPTVLVHEAYERLVGNRTLELADRRHFMACAARAMRAIVVDYARRAGATRRGAGLIDAGLETDGIAAAGFPADLIALDGALQALDTVNPRQREVVELHYFAGMDYAEIGELMGFTERTAKREWSRARAFLHAQMAE